MTGGQELFLKYAFPCTEARVDMGVISLAHRDKLETCVRFGVLPSRRLLKFCFPNAFENLRQLARKTRRSVWSIENVQDYWRNNHGRTGECAVRLITVDAVQGGIVIFKGQFFVNIYNLPVEKGDKVYVHKMCVIEKIDKTLP